VTTFEAIEDLLAHAAGVRAVGVEAVQTVCEDLGADLRHKYLSDRKHLYRRYLAYCLEDKELSEEENADLQHLRFLADLKLDPEEEAFLRRLRGELHLSEQVAAQLYTEGEYSARDRVLSKASAPDRLFLSHRAPAGEFTGRSTTTIEDAVAEALAKATVAIPSLHWFELTHIAGYVEEGQTRGWHVTLHAGVSAER
jgi:flavin-binding protein dodecin